MGNTLFDGSASDDEAVAGRIQDMAFLTGELEDLVADPESFLFGAFDVSRVGWTGHSFGASTVLMAGAMDNRELVGVSLAPAFDDRMSGVYSPETFEVRGALTVVGGTDDTTCEWSQQELAYEHTSAPRFLGQLDGARHFDFTDLCANDLFRMVITSFVEELSDACGDEPTAYHAAVQTLTTATMNRYLACDADAEADLVAPAVDHLANWWADPAGEIAEEDHPLASPWTEPPSTPGEAVTVQVGGNDVEVVRYGTATGRPVVLLPDARFEPEVFWPQVDALAGSNQVILVDSDSAEFAAGVIEALGLSEPAVLGWGTGGQAALELGRRQVAAAVVVVGTAPALDATWADTPDYNGGLTLAHSRHLAMVESDGWDPVVVDMLARGGEASHVAHLLDLLRADATATEEPDLLDELGDITVPVLVIHGEQDDAVLLESAYYLERVLPDARLEVFQRSGHLPFAEEPEAFAAAMLGFLAE